MSGNKVGGCFAEAYGQAISWTEEELMFARIKADNFTMSLHGRKSDYVPEHYPHDYYPASQPKEERERRLVWKYFVSAWEVAK